VNIDAAGVLKTSWEALKEGLESWKPWTFLLLGSFLLLGVPKVAADFLGIADLSRHIQPWPGVAVIVSIAGLGVALLGKLTAHLQQKKKAKLQRASLRSLSPGEKKFLGGYIACQTKTQNSLVHDGVAFGLAARGILFQPTQHKLYDTVAFNLSEWAWEELQKNPELLK